LNKAETLNLASTPHRIHLPLSSQAIGGTFLLFVFIFYGSMILESGRLPIGFLAANFIIISCSSYFLLCGPKHPFSLHSVFYVFSIIFFGFIPISEFTNYT